METSTIHLIIGILVTALVTWIFASWYYKRASEDLVKEAAELKNLNTLILRALENAGFAELNKDENGKPVGLVITLQPKSVVSKSSISKPDLKSEIERS
jgi:hypothetical protein